MASFLGGGIIGGLIAAFASIVVAANTEYISVTQSRVAACFEIANHHRATGDGGAEKLVMVDSAGNIPSQPTIEDHSNNWDRLAASVRMGRELDLCLAAHQHGSNGIDLIGLSMTDLKKCVGSATRQQKGKWVIDKMGTVEEYLGPEAAAGLSDLVDAAGNPLETPYYAGKVNPAC